MQVLKDLIASLNFKQVGGTLFNKSTGLVAGFLAILVVVYVVVISSLTCSIAGDFIKAGLEAARPYLPSFSITNGRLNMRSTEPFILTHEDFYAIMIDAMITVDQKRFGGKNTEAIEMGSTQAVSTQGDTFCLVMDTTGTYKEKIDPSQFAKYAIITQDAIEMVDRIKSMPGNIKPLSEYIQQDISFSPDNIETIEGPIKNIANLGIIISIALATPTRFLLKALIGALLALIVCMIVKREVNFGALYKLSIYSLTPVVLLEMMDSVASAVNIHGIIYQLIYAALVVGAVLAIPKPEQAQAQEEQVQQ